MGRLTTLYEKGEISLKFFKGVIRHGESILLKAGIPTDVNAQLLELLNAIGKMCSWGDYHMVINGKRYEQRFKSYTEWSKYWEKQA